MAAAVTADDAGEPDVVKLYTLNGKFVQDFYVGDLPDSVAFFPNGRYIVTADKGQPSDDYTVNSRQCIDY